MRTSLIVLVVLTVTLSCSTAVAQTNPGTMPSLKELKSRSLTLYGKSYTQQDYARDLQRYQDASDRYLNGPAFTEKERQDIRARQLTDQLNDISRQLQLLQDDYNWRYFRKNPYRINPQPPTKLPPVVLPLKKP